MSATNENTLDLLDSDIQEDWQSYFFDQDEPLDDADLPPITINAEKYKVKEESVCPLCKNILDREIGSPETCAHLFCLKCLCTWAEVSNTCPIDEEKFDLILKFARRKGKITYRHEKGIKVSSISDLQLHITESSRKSISHKLNKLRRKLKKLSSKSSQDNSFENLDYLKIMEVPMDLDFSLNSILDISMLGNATNRRRSGCAQLIPSLEFEPIGLDNDDIFPFNFVPSKSGQQRVDSDFHERYRNSQKVSSLILCHLLSLDSVYDEKPGDPNTLSIHELLFGRGPLNE